MAAVSSPEAEGLTPYKTPDGRLVGVHSTMGILFSDDFGGAAIDATKWDVLDGGLGANPNLGFGALAQAAIGSGIAGITDGVAASALTVNMGTVANAERWYLSKQIFAGAEDLTVILSKSQALVANSIFAGLVEVDPTTGVPLLNPNLAGDFTNRGGVEFGATANLSTFACQAVADSSPLAATGSAATVFSPMNTTSEFLVEFHAEDLIGSNSQVDSPTQKAVNPSRVSSQCPNDAKCYKLLLRFKNVGAPGSNTVVVIQRVLVVNGQELRVEVASGRGDSTGQKAIAVNLQTSNAQLVNTQNNGMWNPSRHKLISAASTNATLVKNARAGLFGGQIVNTNAAWRWLKIYNKASAPVVGTDVPVLTIGLPPNSHIPLAQIVGTIGDNFATGLAYAITANSADNDATAIGAGDVVVNMLYL